MILTSVGILRKKVGSKKWTTSSVFFLLLWRNLPRKMFTNAMSTASRENLSSQREAGWIVDVTNTSNTFTYDITLPMRRYILPITWNRLMFQACVSVSSASNHLRGRLKSLLVTHPVLSHWGRGQKTISNVIWMLLSIAKAFNVFKRCPMHACAHTAAVHVRRAVVHVRTLAVFVLRE